MNELSKLFEHYQSKRIFIHLKSGRKYETSNFQIINNDFACFHDKFSLRVTINLAEILRIEEVRA